MASTGRRRQNMQRSDMLKGCLSIVMWILLMNLATALKDVSMSIPQAVKRGSNALLICNYDLEGGVLYSVKWYKGRKEFYRYTPQEQPVKKIFQISREFRVELNRSNQSHLLLTNVSLSLSGKYVCEISMDAPYFDTALVSGEMRVVELPETQTAVTGIQPRYRIGDLVDGNCSIKYSIPAANLTWTINGIVVSPHHIKAYQIDKHRMDNLESVTSVVHFMVTTQHFSNGLMRLKCTASIYDIFKEEIETIIEEIPTDMMLSAHNNEISNSAYEQHEGSDGTEEHNESFLTYFKAAPSAAAPSAEFFLQKLLQHLKFI